MIYFIQNIETTAVKIGYTAKDPMERLKQLQTGSSDNLDLIGWVEGDQGLEKKLHHEFEKHHIRGEWYHPCLDLGVLLRAYDILIGLGQIKGLVHAYDLRQSCDVLQLDLSLRECITTADDIEKRIMRTEY